MNNAMQYDVERAREFWREARAKVERGDCRFSGMTFPSDPDAQGFYGITFEGPADFSGAVFSENAFFVRAKFTKSADFYDTTFNGVATFCEAVFEESADFRKVTFEKNVSFSKGTFREHAGFGAAEFKATADFDGASFEDSASFPAAKFGSLTLFQEVRFKTGADFTNAVFGGAAAFRKGKFNGGANFWWGTFDRSVDFREVEFAGPAKFWDVTFTRGGNFRNAVFLEKASFDDAESHQAIHFDLPDRPIVPFPPKSRPFQIIGAGETAYRLAKQAAYQHGDYRGAGEYHYAEQCAINWTRRKRATWKPWTRAFWTQDNCRVGPWLEWLFARQVFGYGEKPARPLLFGVMVILICSGLYWQGGVMTDRYTDRPAVTVPSRPHGTASHVRTTDDTSERLLVTHDISEAIYFSIVTFTTLGYGDIRPRAGWIRFVAGGEALAGAALMALFIVALARKYTR